MSEPNQYAAPRNQSFDVVMLKRGVGSHVATPADFKRVRVVAEGPYDARSAPDVAAQETAGFDVLRVCGPGGTTHEEHQATLRAHQAEAGAPLDRTTI